MITQNLLDKDIENLQKTMREQVRKCIKLGSKMEPQMGPQNGPQMGPTNCPTNSSETPSANSVWRTPFWTPGELQKCHFGHPESCRMLENQEGVGFQKIRRRIWSGTPLKFVGQFCRAHSSGQFWGRFWPYLGADFPPRWARFWEPFQDPFSACGKKGHNVERLLRIDRPFRQNAMPWDANVNERIRRAIIERKQHRIFHVAVLYRKLLVFPNA